MRSGSLKLSVTLRLDSQVPKKKRPNAQASQRKWSCTLANPLSHSALCNSYHSRLFSRPALTTFIETHSAYQFLVGSSSRSRTKPCSPAPSKGCMIRSQPEGPEKGGLKVVSSVGSERGKSCATFPWPGTNVYFAGCFTVAGAAGLVSSSCRLEDCPLFPELGFPAASSRRGSVTCSGAGSAGRRVA